MNNSNLRKGIKNTLISIISEIIILFLGLLVPKIIVISYGSEVNGLLSSTTQILSYLALFESGISAVMCNSLYTAFASNDSKSISSIFSAGNKYYKKISLYYGICLFFIAIIFSLSIKTEIDPLSVFIVVVISGAGSLLTFLFLSSIKNVISSDGNYYFIAIVNLVIKALTYISMIIAALCKADIITIKMTGLVVILIQIFIYKFYFKHKYAWIAQVENCSMPNLKQSKYFIIHQSASLLFSCTDILLLTFLTNLSTVSIYTVYNNVIAAISVLMVAISSSFLFILGQMYSLDIKKYKIVHDVFKLFYIEFNFIIISACYFLFTPFITLYMKGADINYSNEIIALLFCLISLLNCSRMTDNNLASISWNVKQTTPHVIIETLINLLLSLLLVIPFGIYGVLIGTSVAILFRVIIAPIYSEKVILKRNVIDGFKHIIINWLCFFFVILLKQCINVNIKNYGSLIIYGIISIIIFFVLFNFINFIFFKKEYKYIFDRLIKRKLRYDKS